MTLAMGTTGEASLIVDGGDLATVLNQVSGDAFPPVLATARMIGLMELAASRAMYAALGEGELSVGVSVDVSHGAATPLGVRVTARATLVAMEGKLFVFDVVASDPGGEIGRGRHKRAIVSSQRLLQGAHRRCGEGA
jgi:predicted thioesterase